MAYRMQIVFEAVWNFGFSTNSAWAKRLAYVVVGEGIGQSRFSYYTYPIQVYSFKGITCTEAKPKLFCRITLPRGWSNEKNLGLSAVDATLHR